jgi:hypothetical protein
VVAAFALRWFSGEKVASVPGAACQMAALYPHGRSAAVHIVAADDRFSLT